MAAFMLYSMFSGNQRRYKHEIVRKLKQVVAKVDNSRGNAIHMTSSKRVVKDGYKKRRGTMIHISKKFAGSSLDK